MCTSFVTGEIFAYPWFIRVLTVHRTDYGAIGTEELGRTRRVCAYVFVYSEDASCSEFYVFMLQRAGGQLTHDRITTTTTAGPIRRYNAVD